MLRDLAPEHLAEDWDKVGLHLGDPNWPVLRAMLCIDLTAGVLAEAIQQKANLIVAYHPPIFTPLAAVTTNDWKQRIILQAVAHKIAIYSSHTALDAAAGGVNDWLCEGVGRGEVRAMRPSSSRQLSYKIVTFVPHENADALRACLARAGAGQIGDYSICSFNSDGEGTFLGGETTKPTIGQAGRLERVPELRLEMVCDSARLAEAVDALRAAHPYEEPARDIYRLEASPQSTGVGQGRLVTLQRPISLAALVRRLKKHLGVPKLEAAVPDEVGPIRRVGLYAGAGGPNLDQAGPIEAFITGEMRHHDVLAARAKGIVVLLAGHTQTERPYLPRYRERIVEQLGTKVAWSISVADRPPSVWM